MSRWFSIESPLMTGLTKLADLIIVNLIAIVCCLPIITIGASMTALNYVEIENLGLGDLTSQDIRVNIMYDIPLDENMVKACIYAMRQSLSLFDPCDAGVQYYQDVLNKLLQF